MKRRSIEQLIRWKNSGKGIPLLLTGAKGVGKTYLAYDFAKAFFEHIYYVNLEQDSLMREFIVHDLTESLDRLKQTFHISNENSADTGVLILDEVGCCEKAFGFLKQPLFMKQFPYVICISSKPINIDTVKELKQISVFPLEFDEFLIATGNEWYIELIQTHYKANNKLPEIVHKELLDLFQLYLTIGGMPGSINEYLNLNSMINISEQHKVLWGAIRNYINNEYQENDSFKMLQVLECVGHQLMKDNKKFQYKLIRKGTTHSMYKDSIQKLCNCNYIIRCNRIESGNLLEGEENEFGNSTNTFFKLYLSDTGILNTKLVQEYDPLSNRYFSKALLENYTAQMLRSKQYPFAFWESESMARIDFIIKKDEKIIPLELFPDQNTRSKSLSVFKQKMEYPYAVKASTKNFEFTGNIKYVPYYALFCI